jgi:hypothetical protein
VVWLFERTAIRDRLARIPLQLLESAPARFYLFGYVASILTATKFELIRRLGGLVFHSFRTHWSIWAHGSPHSPTCQLRISRMRLPRAASFHFWTCPDWAPRFHPGHQLSICIAGDKSTLEIPSRLPHFRLSASLGSDLIHAKVSNLLLVTITRLA